MKQLNALLLSLLIGTLVQASEEQRPNIVVIFVDDMGYADPSCFGNPAMKTPQIDRLAADGLKLTNFYVNSPICSASRVALTTGQYQQRFRIHSFFAGRKSNRDRKMPDWLDPRAPTLAKILKKNGYHTAHFGKWHMGGGRDVDDAPLPRRYGFDESLVSFEGLGDRILFHKKNDSWHHARGTIEGVEKHETSKRYVDRTIDFIERYKDEPFYVRFFPNDVHDAHLPSEERLSKWKGSSANPPDEKFFAVLEELDHQIGRILDTLDRLELTDNTLVMFTSDNGPTDWPNYYRKKTTPPGFTGPLFGRKWSLYEGGIRMPFIVRWPGRVPTGETDEESLMCAIDWLPTAAKLAGCDLPNSKFDGEDRSSVLLGNPSERSAPIFWEYGVHGSIKPGKFKHRSPQLAMRDGDWKLLCNPDDSDTRLFNLKSDIGEKENLESSHRERVANMRKQLLAWWREMNAHYENLEASPAVTSDDVEFVIGPHYADATEFFARRNVPRGTVHRFTMKSANSNIYPGIAKRKQGVVPYERDVVVYVPTDYEPGTPTPFIIVQDGNWYTSMSRVLDNMIHDKRIPPMVAIMIDSGGGDSKGSQRGLEYDTVSGLYAEFVETEVLPKISADYDITFTSDPNGRATMGGSSGGAAAFSMAWYRPDLYRRVLCYSGTFVDQQWPENSETPDGAWEYHKRLIAESPKKPLRIWLHVSEFDNGYKLDEASLHNWVLANKRMATELKKKGYEYRYVFAKDARHIDYRVTKQTLPGALEWLWKGYPVGE